MAFEGGPLATVGITPAFLSQLATQTASSGVQNGLGQIWQSGSQSFIGSAGQALVGNLAGSVVNIGINSLLGTQVVGPAGLSLTSGSNFLASTLTPFITSTVAAGLNQSIQQSLASAGPFGPALSTLGTGLVNQLFGGLGDAIAGGVGNSENFKMFPGGGGEPPADYGGSAYTLTDVVFSIQPANQGPQSSGLEQGSIDPKADVSQAVNTFGKLPPIVPNLGADIFKNAAMNNQIGSRAFSPNFNVSTASSFSRS